VSHDLRTRPLASITGAASSIAQDSGKLPPETIAELGPLHPQGSRSAFRIVNLLDVTNLESGTVS